MHSDVTVPAALLAPSHLAECADFSAFKDSHFTSIVGLSAPSEAHLAQLFRVLAPGGSVYFRVRA
jgi:hypothetical protein